MQNCGKYDGNFGLVSATEVFWFPLCMAVFVEHGT